MKKFLTLLFAMVLCIAANAQVNLADVINKTLEEQKPENGFYAVLLDSNNEYVLNSQINLGQNKLSIWGGGAIVKVEGDGQIATQTYFTVNGVNFDLAAANKAPLALEAVTKDALPEVYTKDNYPGANQDVPHYDYKYSIFGCNFANVKNGVFYDNGKWAIQTLEIKNCIINIADDMNKIVFENMGAIQKIDMSGNTIYMVAQNEKKNVIKFANASNAQPQKVWGDDAKAYYFVTNNTFCNLIKNFGDQCPSKNNVICTVKGNIFYNTVKFQNKFVGNCVKDYTANDNIQFGNPESGLGVEKDPGFKAPVALDLKNPAALKDCFATDLGAGAPAWCNVKFYGNIKKTAGQNYEAVLMPSVLKASTKGTAADFVINSELYPWVKFIDLGSDGNGNYDNFGNYEVTRGGAYSSIDIVTGEPTEGKKYPNPWGGEIDGFQYVTNNATENAGAPKINADYKSMEFGVTNVTKVRFVLSGGAGRADNSARIVVINALTGDTLSNVVSENMNQKSNGAAASKTDSKTVTVEGLDADAKYIVKVLRNTGDAYVYAIHLWGTDLSVANEVAYYSMGETYKSEKGKANYEVIYTPNLLTKKLQDNFNKAMKPAMNDAVAWADYKNFSSVLVDGSHEVSVGNCYTSYNVYTQEEVEADKMEMLGTGADGEWYGYPKVEAAKEFTFRVQDVMTVGLLLTGSGSNNNVAVADVNNGEMEWESDPMPGKSQAKAIGEGSKATNSSIMTLFVNPEAQNTITIRAKEGATAIAAIYLTNDFWFEFTPANELGETDGIANVEAAQPFAKAAFNVAGQRVANTAKGLIIVNGKKFFNK